MRIIIEAVSDDRAGAVILLREAAGKIARSKEEHAKAVDYCLGSYRVLVEDEGVPIVATRAVATGCTPLAGGNGGPRCTECGETDPTKFYSRTYAGKVVWQQRCKRHDNAHRAERQRTSKSRRLRCGSCGAIGHNARTCATAST